MTKQKSSLRAKRPARRAAALGRTPSARLRQTWEATLSALSGAEQEVQKQVRVLLEKNQKATTEAGAALRGLSRRVQKERKKALRQVETRLGTLQARVKKERRAAQRMVDDAFHGALAALNIPSRHEVFELTRKVDELSRKIDAFRETGRPGRRAVPVHA